MLKILPQNINLQHDEQEVSLSHHSFSYLLISHIEILSFLKARADQFIKRKKIAGGVIFVVRQMLLKLACALL